MIEAAVIIFTLCITFLFYQWREHEFQKWLNGRSETSLSQALAADSARINSLIELQNLLKADVEDYKKRVDSLTLKAGFKL